MLGGSGLFKKKKNKALPNLLIFCFVYSSRILGQAAVAVTVGNQFMSISLSSWKRSILQSSVLTLYHFLPKSKLKIHYFHWVLVQFDSTWSFPFHVTVAVLKYIKYSYVLLLTSTHLQKQLRTLFGVFVLLCWLTKSSSHF